MALFTGEDNREGDVIDKTRARGQINLPMHDSKPKVFTEMREAPVFRMKAEIQSDSHHAHTDPWDKFGIFLSSLCAVHCLLTPFLVLAIPWLAEKFENPWVHIVLALFVVPVGLYALWSGYRHHRRKYILVLGLIGLALVTSATLELPFSFDIGLHAHDEHAHDFTHEIVTIVGSLFLLSAHILNLRSCRCKH